MKLFMLVTLATVAVAAPQGYTAPPRNTYSAPCSVDSGESVEHIPILRDDRVRQDDGKHNFEFETANGIAVSQAGDSDGDQQGEISFTHPDGTEFHLTYVADENGFQPQSSALPVAPAFPHPIPDFVLEQIEFARQQKLAESSEEFVRTPSRSYASPNRKRRQAPSSGYSAPRFVDSAESAEHIPILRDDRYREDDGKHNFEFETANGIAVSQAGDSDGDQQGEISFTHPDGSEFHLTYVADENGFQPQSSALPVAPAFPHPIPDFVLEQIEFARQQKEAESREVQFVRTPSGSYSSPNRK